MRNQAEVLDIFKEKGWFSEGEAAFLFGNSSKERFYKRVFDFTENQT